MTMSSSDRMPPRVLPTPLPEPYAKMLDDTVRIETDMVGVVTGDNRNRQIDGEFMKRQFGTNYAYTSWAVCKNIGPAGYHDPRDERSAVEGKHWQLVIRDCLP